MKCCSKLWKKPWTWLYVAKTLLIRWLLSPPVSSMCSSVSVAFVLFGEDPVTQIVDLFVLVIGGLHLQNHKLNSICIAGPWNHAFCHPRSTVTLWNEGLWIPQFPHNNPPSFHLSHTHPRYSPAPCERLHAQHYQLLAEMHFFFSWFGIGETGHFQPCPYISPSLFMWIYAQRGRPALLLV